MVQKIVEFEKWCPKCIHFDKPENEEPCWECLTNATNEDSHRPINFKKANKKEKKDED